MHAQCDRQKHLQTSPSVTVGQRALAGDPGTSVTSGFSLPSNTPLLLADTQQVQVTVG